MAIKTWTIFGIGNFTLDVIDAIHATNGVIIQIVVNQPPLLDIVSHLSNKCRIIALDEKWNMTTDNIFGFVNPNKEKFLQQLQKYSLSWSNVIHPRSYVSPLTKLGVGNYIGPNAVIGPGGQIGDFNYINRNATLGHHLTIDNYNHVGPSATICGRCQIGSKNTFGANSTIIDGLSISEGVTIGAGAVVTKNITQSGIYTGVPAKLNKPGDA